MSGLLLIFQFAPVCEATPLHDVTGEWTNVGYAGSNWGYLYDNTYAIHMALTRGAGTPYHSHILWWAGANEDAFGGREMAWRPFNTDCDDWADSSFIAITVQPPHMNTFCAGHTGLADGRLFVAGGNDSVNTIAGERGARIWKQGVAQGDTNWINANQMREHRWYPTTTMLADGKVLVLTGLQNELQAIFGGREDGAIPSQAVADSVRLFEPVPGGQWYQSVIPDSVTSGSAPHKPDWREFHSAVGMDEYSYGVRTRDTYFGGRDEAGHARNDTWFLRREPNLLGATYSYRWEKGPTTNLPDARSEHVAVASQGSNASMYVFGGLGDDSLTRNDLRQLYLNFGAWTWTTPTDSGSAPSARYGHAAFYDEIPGPSNTTLRRMIVFGGTGSAGAAPTDSGIYEMRITGAHTVSWTQMTKRQLGDGSPSPRLGHAMDVDMGWPRRFTFPDSTYLDGHVAFLFGGQTGANTYSNELWALWIFNDGTVGWQKMRPGDDNAPSPRTHATLIVDPRQGREDPGGPPSARVYVFGGENGSGAIDKDQYEVDPWFTDPAWYKWAQAGAKASGHTTLKLAGISNARVAEVFDPADNNSWTTHESANLLQEGYGPTFLVSGGSTAAGRVFAMGIDDAAYHLDVASGGGSGGWSAYSHGALGFDSEAMVMYRPGKIMAAGGYIGVDNAGLVYQDTSWVGRTKKFDIAQPDSAWKQAAYGSGAGSLTPRRFHNLCILPDGKVIAIGGLRAYPQDAFAFATRYPQIWDPDGAGGMGAWTDSTQLAIQPHLRNYHSTAILLPDGRILSDGGYKDAPDHDIYYADVYCPPYLFSGDTLATRPTLEAALGRWRYNASVSFAVSGDTTIRRVALIRAPSTTHAFDQGQRYIPLTLTSSDDPGTGTREYFVTAPADSFIAPPGDYMLFVLDANGVPSIAKWVRMGSTYAGQFDTTAPDTLATIQAEFITSNALYPMWTAPGDDGNTGIALDYDLRYSTSQLTDGNFTGANRFSSIPQPRLAGTTQDGAIATGLSTCSWFYVAGKTRDRAEQWSGVGGRTRIKTLCSGGGGGLSAVRDRAGAAGMRGAERLPQGTGIPGYRGFAAPTEVTGSATTQRLVGNFTHGESVQWEVAFEDLGGQSDLLALSASQVVMQEPAAAGGWKTRATAPVSPGSLGMRSLKTSGRVIFPAGTSLEAVELQPVSFTCESATHSRLGNLVDLAETSPEFMAGDTLELSYVTSEGSEDGEDCFFRVVIPTPAGQSRTHETPRGPATGADLPTAFALHSAHPNPFSRATSVRFDLPRASDVRIEVFDVQGRRIATLANSRFEAGRQAASWDGSSEGGGRAPAGVYLCRMKAGAFTAEKRISLLP